MPASRSASLISIPMKPAPTMAALLQDDSRSHALIRIASSSFLRVKTPSRPSPGIPGIRGVVPVPRTRTS